MTSSTPPDSRLPRRVFLAAAAAAVTAGYLQHSRTPASAAVVVTPAPRPHNTLLGVL
ncbi:hypothetical protein GCM10009804_46640 [Kribbella hippodromi]|uniref:Uncharacterized protein n=1 Tax=Kribbella hippodromi TaxID=434347 RepID=A0ABN2DTU5_9ACTN